VVDVVGHDQIEVATLLQTVANHRWTHGDPRDQAASAGASGRPIRAPFARPDQQENLDSGFDSAYNAEAMAGPPLGRGVGCAGLDRPSFIHRQ
jgi:hypothetical protein